MNRKYTMSPKRIYSDIKKNNWSIKIDVLILKERDKLSFSEIGKRLGISRQRAHQHYKSLKGKTLLELQELQRRAEGEN